MQSQPKRKFQRPVAFYTRSAKYGLEVSLFGLEESDRRQLGHYATLEELDRL